VTARVRRRPRGFSLVELVIAMALALAVVGALAAIVDPSHALFSGESRRIDVQQRARTVTITLTESVRMAGAGPHASAAGGPLLDSLAPVLPFRRTASGGDPPGIVRSDAITVLAVPFASGEARLAAPLGASDTTMTIDTSTCAARTAACGFSVGDTALVFDGSGRWDAFAITAVEGGVLSIRTSSRTGGGDPEYAVGSVVAAASLVSFFLESDPDTGGLRLVASDGLTIEPVADDVADLAFEYYADPKPPVASGPECAFVVDPLTGARTPRLPLLTPSDSGLVTLSPDQLADGPWCPDADSPVRWDADLLRVRAVAVSIRFVAPADAGQTVHFMVTPPNLNFDR